MKPKNTICGKGIPTAFLRFLSTCVYGDAAAYYKGLSEAEQSELDAHGRAFAMSEWFYRFLCDVLPEEKRTEYQKIYQAQQVRALIGAQELKSFYGVLVSHNLRFVALKGADLAYRLYPDAALRNFCDWDIWFHPDDCERMIAVLAEDGWKELDEAVNDLDVAQAIGAHHFSGHVRGQYMIEPHFTLANFDGVDPHEMWAHTLDYSDGNGQRVLSPEMNLLMLTRHAATKSYFHAQLPKLLTDAAFLIQREKVNFDELRKLANSWNLPYPGNLLAAFPEFFPSDVIAEFKADSKSANAFRQVFETRSKLGEQESTALTLSRYETRGHVAGGMMKHVRAHSPAKMRILYHLPEHGAWGGVVLAYIHWFGTRAWRARIWVKRNPLLREYARMVETAESTQK